MEICTDLECIDKYKLTRSVNSHTLESVLGKVRQQRPFDRLLLVHARIRLINNYNTSKWIGYLNCGNSSHCCYELHVLPKLSLRYAFVCVLCSHQEQEVVYLEGRLQQPLRVFNTRRFTPIYISHTRTRDSFMEGRLYGSDHTRPVDVHMSVDEATETKWCRWWKSIQKVIIIGKEI